MILEKNNVTFQELNKFYIELLNSLICTPKNSNHVRSQQIRPGKQIDLFVYCICISCCIIMWHQSLQYCSVRETMDNWTTPKYSFEKHTRHDSPWWQPIYTLHYQAGFFVFDKFSLLVNLGDESGGV